VGHEAFSVDRSGIQGIGEENCWKETTWKTRHGLKDNIKMDVQELGFESMYFIDLAQHTDRWRTLVNAVMNLRVTRNVENFLTN
jgi:hypothetical protein